MAGPSGYAGRSVKRRASCRSNLQTQLRLIEEGMKRICWY